MFGEEPYATMTPASIPEGLCHRTTAQRAAVASMPAGYARIVAHSLLTVSVPRLLLLWQSYDGQLPDDRDPIVALAERMVAPVYEARRMLQLQGGDTEAAIANLQHFLLCPTMNMPAPIVRDAIAYLRAPQAFTAVFAAAS